MERGPVLGDVDVLAAEHRVAASRDAARERVVTEFSVAALVERTLAALPGMRDGRRRPVTAVRHAR